MSLRGQQVGKYARMARERYFTPEAGVLPLLSYAEQIGLFHGIGEVWECAAGAGHIAKVLAERGLRVLATDIEPAEEQVHPVAPLDFLKSSGPSGNSLGIVTNPPYGFQNREAMAFLRHGLSLLNGRHGCLALLLPFEFDTRASRHDLTWGHPWFLAKVTCATRLVWANLPKTENTPMGTHSWFVWSNQLDVVTAAGRVPRHQVL